MVLVGAYVSSEATSDTTIVRLDLGVLFVCVPPLSLAIETRPVLDSAKYCFGTVLRECNCNKLRENESL